MRTSRKNSPHNGSIPSLRSVVSALAVCAVAVVSTGCGARAQAGCPRCSTDPNDPLGLDPLDDPTARFEGPRFEGPRFDEPRFDEPPSNGSPSTDNLPDEVLPGEQIPNGPPVDEPPGVVPIDERPDLVLPPPQPLRCQSQQVRTVQELESLRGCAVVAGDLAIFGAFSNLEPLSSLTRVDGELRLEQTVSLRGLDSLVQVDHLIIENARIRDLEGLGSLQSLNDGSGQLIVAHNRRLGSFEGLGFPLAVGVLVVEDNPELVSLESLRTGATLASLTVIENRTLSESFQLGATIIGTVEIRENFLPTLALLTGVERVGRLVLQFNRALQSLEGLESLTAVNELLRIGQVAAINLDPLANLVSAGRIIVSENQQLQNVNGLGQLRSVEELTFERLPLLESLPTFGNLARMRELALLSNLVLDSGPNLPQLTDLTVLRIEDNASLTDVSGLGALQTLETLSISHNAGLVTLAFPALQAVTDEATVRCNAQLPVAEVERLENADIRRLSESGNLGSDTTCSVEL